MKRLFVCVLIFILALCVAAPVSAESDSAFYAFVRVTKAKVYSGADMATGIGTLEKFEIVRVEDYTSETCMVTKSGKTGYMYIKDLSRVDSIDKSASITARVKVYTKPSTSAKGSYVAKGTGVTVIAVNGSWAMIEKNGNTGYIKTSYLKYVNIAQVVTPKPTATPTVKPENTPVICDFSARVSVSSVTVYAAASTSSTKLGTMKNGTVVTVKAYNPTWAYIELNGRTGYCAKSALTKIASTVTPTITPQPTPSPTTVPEADPMRECAPFNVIASVEKAKVYSEPALTSKYLGYISGSTEVSVLAYNSVWAKIELNGKIGYALKIELVKPGSVTPTPTMVPSPTPTPTPSPTPAPTPTATPVPTATATAQVYPESTDPIFTDKTTTNQEKAFLFLSLDTDYNEAVACGLIANMMSESSCNPKSKNSAGYRGICQWSTSRFAILESWCIENKLDPDSLEGQLKFLRYDLSKRYTVYHKYLLTVENTAQGAYDAGYYFCLKYERPGNTEAASVKRGTNAKDIYWPKFVENK